MSGAGQHRTRPAAVPLPAQVAQMKLLMLSEALSQYIENAGDPEDWTPELAGRIDEATALMDSVDEAIVAALEN